MARSIIMLTILATAFLLSGCQEITEVVAHGFGTAFPSLVPSSIPTSTPIPTPTPKPKQTNPWGDRYKWIILPQGELNSVGFVQQITESNQDWEIWAPWDSYQLEAFQTFTGYGAVNLYLKIELFNEELVGEGYCTSKEIVFEGVSSKQRGSLSVETIFPTQVDGEWGYYSQHFFLTCHPETGWLFITP